MIQKILRKKIAEKNKIHNENELTVVHFRKKIIISKKTRWFQEICTKNENQEIWSNI